VICTDKTGTLTTGKMRVREVVLRDGLIHPIDDPALSSNLEFVSLLRSSVLCSNASLAKNGQTSGDPTEVALLLMAQESGQNPNQLHAAHPRLKEWTFDSNRKRMSVAAREDSRAVIHVKGAPESLLPLCRLSNEESAIFTELAATLSQKGRRLLAVARTEQPALDALRPLESHESVEHDLELLGLVSISDPPRSESLPAIAACLKAGIHVVMITGDHPATAKAIAAELGILQPGKFDGVLSGPELLKLSDEGLKQVVTRTAVYARVSPEDKLRIIGAWKQLGHVVAMTGDGVNDAPALKAATIGIAMGKGGTEVARQASSMILTDDCFATIVGAVEEGRAIYGNIRRTIQYLLSGNLAEILIMLGAALAGWPTPLAPIHLLWINLVTDGLPSLALAAEPIPNGSLADSTKPSPRNFFSRTFYAEMGFVSGVTALLALGVYGYSLKYENEAMARTHVFSFLVFAELFRSFASRSETKTFFQMGLFSNVYHLVAVAIPIGFQLVLHHTTFFQEVFKVQAVSWHECLILAGLTLIPVTAVELKKTLFKERSTGSHLEMEHL
jgi:P-type Ca2+ transporter type 2C